MYKFQEVGVFFHKEVFKISHFPVAERTKCIKNRTPEKAWGKNTRKKWQFFTLSGFKSKTEKHPGSPGDINEMCHFPLP